MVSPRASLHLSARLMSALADMSLFADAVRLSARQERMKIIGRVRYNRNGMQQLSFPVRLRTRLQQTATFVFLFYVLFLLGRSAWANTQSNQKREALKTQIAALSQNNKDLEHMILYQQTETFKELEARRRLGLKRPGELVIALPPEPDISNPDQPPTIANQPESPLPAWWNYYVK